MVAYETSVRSLAKGQLQKVTICARGADGCDVNVRNDHDGTGLTLSYQINVASLYIHRALALAITEIFPAGQASK